MSVTKDHGKVALGVLQREGRRIEQISKYVEELEKDRAKLLDLAARLMAPLGVVRVRRTTGGNYGSGRQHHDHPDSRVVHAFDETFGTYGHSALLDELLDRFQHLKHREL